MGKHIALLNVDYEDGKADSYKRLELSYGDTEKFFDSGDPLLDWYAYHKFIYSGQADKEGIFMVSGSSSVDHWFMDTNDYTEEYLTEKDGEWEIMNDDDIHRLSFSDIDKSVKCVIGKGIKTFKELKEYVKKHEQKA